MSPEIRTFQLTELRADPESKKIRGHAAVFNQWSDDLGGFREMVMPHAFDETLEKDDIWSAVNHDVNLILGRNTSGTLTLKVDDVGLYFEADPPDTSYARDYATLIERGDISQCSFQFSTLEDKWGRNEDVMPGGEVRELHKVKLFELGPVAMPAYPQTDTYVRNLWPVGTNLVNNPTVDWFTPPKFNSWSVTTPATYKDGNITYTITTTIPEPRVDPKPEEKPAGRLSSLRRRLEVIRRK